MIKIPWQSLIALSMASAERIDESDIVFLQEEQPWWIINRCSQVQKQNLLTWQWMESKTRPGDNADGERSADQPRKSHSVLTSISNIVSNISKLTPSHMTESPFLLRLSSPPAQWSYARNYFARQPLRRSGSARIPPPPPAPNPHSKLTASSGVLARCVLQQRGKGMWWLLSVKADLYRSDCSDNGDCLSYLSVDQILTARPWSSFPAN